MALFVLKESKSEIVEMPTDDATHVIVLYWSQLLLWL